MKRLLALFIIYFTLSPIFAGWEPFFFTDAGSIYFASSELEKLPEMMEIGKYSPKNLSDKNTSTAWVEGEKGPGIGSFVLLGTGISLKQYIIIYNGYQQSENLFKKNNRVKEFKVSLYAGFTSDDKVRQTGFEADSIQYEKSAVIALKDQMDAQVIKMPFDSGKVLNFMSHQHEKYIKEHESNLKKAGVIDSFKYFYFLKFEIISVYKGSKWDDTCISEIEFSTRKDGEYIPSNISIIGLFQDVETGDIDVLTSSGSALSLVNTENLARQSGYTGKDEFFTLALMDVSPAKEWVIINYQHGFVNGGNVEETNHLWSVRRRQVVPDFIMRSYGVSPLAFVRKDGILYLDTYEDKKIILADIELDLENNNS